MFVQFILVYRGSGNVLSCRQSLSTGSADVLRQQQCYYNHNALNLPLSTAYEKCFYEASPLSVKLLKF